MSQEFKPGSDGISLSWDVSERVSLSFHGFFGVLAEKESFGVSLQGITLLSRAKIGLDEAEMGFTAGYVRGDLVLGADCFIDLGPGDLYAELTLSYLTSESLTPNHQRRCTKAKGESPSCAGTTLRVPPRAVVGFRFKPTDNLTANLEIYVNGFGNMESGQYLSTAISERASIGEISSTGILYLAGLASWSATALLKLDLILVSNLLDPSVLVAFNLHYSLSGDALLIAGAYIGAGKRAEIQQVHLASEYGSLRPAIFIGLKHAF